MHLCSLLHTSNWTHTSASTMTMVLVMIMIGNALWLKETYSFIFEDFWELIKYIEYYMDSLGKHLAVLLLLQLSGLDILCQIWFIGWTKQALILSASKWQMKFNLNPFVLCTMIAILEGICNRLVDLVE